MLNPRGDDAVFFLSVKENSLSVFLPFVSNRLGLDTRFVLEGVEGLPVRRLEPRIAAAASSPYPTQSSPEAGCLTLFLSLAHRRIFAILFVSVLSDEKPPQLDSLPASSIQHPT